MNIPDFQSLHYLCIGHCTHDLADNRFLPGGTVYFSGKILKALGVQSFLLTSFGQDFQYKFLINQLFNKSWIQDSADTTVFENKDDGGFRRQNISSRASVINSLSRSLTKQRYQIVHFAPVADEIAQRLLDKPFPGALKVATIQGWMRIWDKNGKISPKNINPHLLAELDIAILSDEDHHHVSMDLAGVSRNGVIIVETLGSRGALIYIGGETLYFPAIKIDENQTVGAGDVFACFFFLIYYFSKCIYKSVSWAHAAASYHVSGSSFAEEKSLKFVGEVAERYYATIRL